LIPDSYRFWNRDNPLARSLSRVLCPVIYLFSTNSGYVAGYSIFTNGEQVETQALPWKDGVALNEDDRPPLPPPGTKTALGEALGEPMFDYPRFARGFRSLEKATATLVAKFGSEAHLMDPLDMSRGYALAVDGGRTVRVELAGWTCVTWRRGRAEPGAPAYGGRDSGLSDI
jgi:hypothetical protein